MKRDDALTLSEYLESQRAPHHVRYTPNYGYTVRVDEDAMTDDIRDDIEHLAGMKPVHGVEYR